MKIIFLYWLVHVWDCERKQWEDVYLKLKDGGGFILSDKDESMEISVECPEGIVQKEIKIALDKDGYVINGSDMLVPKSFTEEGLLNYVSIWLTNYLKRFNLPEDCVLSLEEGKEEDFIGTNQSSIEIEKAREIMKKYNF